MAINIPSNKNDKANINNTEDIILIWIDPSVDDDENLDVQRKLATIHRNFMKFSTVPDGEKVIRQLPESNQIILIVSGGFGKELVPRIHQLKQILVIYIFCMEREKHTEWALGFEKIKTVITESEKLFSTIEFDHEQRMDKKKIEQMAVPNIDSDSGMNNGKTLTKKDGDVFRYSFKHFVKAGELQYTEQTMENIGTDIVRKYKENNTSDMKTLIDEAIQPVFYMLKRQQTLEDFFNSLKVEMGEFMENVQLSQRSLIDTIMMNSDRFLCQTLMLLLSKRNPVPMVQPQTDLIKSPYRSILSIIPLWDYQRPILLSFGIGQCKGKSSLMNATFESNFEESMNNSYFNGTIDVDFGFHFNERRPVNIADAHGEISLDILKQILMLFTGFLVHVECAYLCSNRVNVVKYLTLLPCDVYIQLIIRDVVSENDGNLKTTIDDLRRSFPHCYISSLPNIIDKNKLQNKNKIKKLQETIFNYTCQISSLNEKVVQEGFKRLLNDDERKTIEQDETFIQHIHDALIKGKIDEYPLYCLFENMCKKRSQVAKMDPYDKNFESDKLLQLNDELFHAYSEFKNKQKMNSDKYGAGFQDFLKLLSNEELRSNHLRLLSMELKREWKKKEKNHQDLPFYERLSLEIHWRNIIIGSTSLPNDKQQMLISAYRDYMLEGYPFEIVDGDNFEMQHHFLTSVFQLFPNKKFFIVSVIGPQNSGKSTLLNFLFGTSFEARDGRCTKGIYGTLVNIQNGTSNNKFVPLDYDYILVIDTEGLMSIQKDDEQYNQSLVLFCLAVSHLIIINVEGEINEPMKKCFLLCTQALEYLGETRARRPTVHFVLNKRAESNIDYCKTLVENVLKTLNDNKLNTKINFQKENFHVLNMAFNSKPFIDKYGECAASKTNPTFIVNIQKLCKFIIDTSSDIIRATGDTLCIATNWINFANRVFQTIKKHPNLTYFKDVFERNQFKDVRQDIQQDFDQYLSPPLARILIERDIQNESENLKIFDTEYNRVLKILEEKLNEHLNKHEATENIRDRSFQFMKVQITNMFQSWKVSASMKSERNKNKKMVTEINDELRKKAISVTHKNCLMDYQEARKMFEDNFDSLLNEKIADNFSSGREWTRCIELVTHLCDALNADDLPSINNFMEYKPFLETLDSSIDEFIPISDCLSKIQVECSTRASNLEPLVLLKTEGFSTIITKDLGQQYSFLDNENLSDIFQQLHATNKQTRQSIRRGARQQFSALFHENWKIIVKVPTCFDKLTKEIEECLISRTDNEFSIEITFVQKILGIVNAIIQDFNNELRVFNFCLSKDFCSYLYTCTVILTALYYYHQHRNHFRDVIKTVRENKPNIVEKYIPWVVLVKNNDENVATELIKELSRIILLEFNTQVKNIVENRENNDMNKLRRSIIIQELDSKVHNATDVWLINYVLDPESLIIERFEEKWMILKVEVDKELNKIIKLVKLRISEISQLINTINSILHELGGDSLTFVDNLFEAQSAQIKCHPSDKKFCMARLFYTYLTGEQPTKEITTDAGLIYKIDDQWKNLVDKFGTPDENIRQVFRLTQNVFETATISYLGLFLDKVQDQLNKAESTLTPQTHSFIDETYKSTHDLLIKEVQGCGKRCPCCKRICDVDHHLNIISPVGQRENRHCCQFGHQIRGMGGIRYEVTNEASIAWCEIITDNDLVTTKDNNRQTWKKFKISNTDWDFGEPLIRETLETHYFSIWKRIGRNLCERYNNGMKFVEKNSPLPINHFIFILDHSGSMNETNPSSPETTPWHHLLDAVKAFLEIRIRYVSLNDRITIIVFANRAERIYYHEKLENIDIERLKIPMKICGEGTKYATAFQMTIKTLEEVNNLRERLRFRQTIIFMTDGEPQDDSNSQLQTLCGDWREGIASNQSDKALINNFWIMALGQFNKMCIEAIERKIHGKLVNIANPEELVEAYAQLAEII